MQVSTIYSEVREPRSSLDQNTASKNSYARWIASETYITLLNIGSLIFVRGRQSRRSRPPLYSTGYAKYVYHFTSTLGKVAHQNFAVTEKYLLIQQADVSAAERGMRKRCLLGGRD